MHVSSSLPFHTSEFHQPADNQTFIGVEMLRVLFGHVIVLLGVGLLFCPPSLGRWPGKCACCCWTVQVIHHHALCDHNRCEHRSASPPAPRRLLLTSRENGEPCSELLSYTSQVHSLSECNFEWRDVINLHVCAVNFALLPMKTWLHVYTHAHCNVFRKRNPLSRILL